MKSLLPIQQTKVPLPFCLLYPFSSPSSQLEANLVCCFMSLHSTSITCEVLFTPNMTGNDMTGLHGAQQAFKLEY